MHVLSIDQLSVRFQPHKQNMLMRQRLLHLLKRESGGGFYALDGVSFSAGAGEGIAVIGQNGAGKSTLLSVIAGVLPPQHGSVRVRGRVGALLELGAGFHPDLTGRENLTLYGALMGLTQAQLDERFNQIVEFTELGPFIDEPLRNYSAGMRLRLGFSVAAHSDSSVVLIDEVLAVGDAAFAQKCIGRIAQLKAEGRLILCVTHSVESLGGLCERGIWLHCGRLVQDGPIHEVAAAYAAFMADPHRRFRDETPEH